METKKHPHLELTNKRSLLFHFALMTSISIVLFAFEWKSKKVEKIPFSGIVMENWENLPDIPLTIQQLPPPPINPPIIIEIPDNEILEKEITQIDINLDNIMMASIPTILSPPVMETADEVLDFSEKMPEPLGGMQAWTDYLKKKPKISNTSKKTGDRRNGLHIFYSKYRW